MSGQLLQDSQTQTGEPGYATGLLLVALAGVCWSLMPLGIRLIESGTVWHILFYRSLGMVPMVFALMAWRSRGHPLRVITKAGMTGVVGGVSLVLAYACGIGAIQLTSVANAAFLFATAPFMAALLSYVLLRESVRKATWLAMAVGLAGIGFMVADSFTTGNWTGDVVALGAALGFALFTVALRWGRAGDTPSPARCSSSGAGNRPPMSPCRCRRGLAARVVVDRSRRSCSAPRPCQRFCSQSMIRPTCLALR
jgi:DME family drug/metabolite transporter